MHYVNSIIKSKKGKVMTEVIKQAKGTVKSFNPVKGYGFISCEDDLDLDIYVHFTQILMDGKRTLTIGDRVEFLYKPFEDKGLRAYQVKKLD
jgi:CspA family cold shock protein